MVRGETSYGVEERHPEPNDEIDAALETLTCRGFAMVPDRLSAVQIADLNSRLEKVGSHARRHTSFDDATDLSAFCDGARALAHSGALGAAMDLVAQFVVEVISHGSSWANVFSSPVLDRLCLEFGRLGG